MHQAEGVGNIRVYVPEVLISLHVRGELVRERERNPVHLIGRLFFLIFQVEKGMHGMSPSGKKGGFFNSDRVFRRGGSLASPPRG